MTYAIMWPSQPGMHYGMQGISPQAAAMAATVHMTKNSFQGYSTTGKLYFQSGFK
jgi:hypothetical protein